VLHDFDGGDGVGTDGSSPSGGLIFDSAGNLYGATARVWEPMATAGYSRSRGSLSTWGLITNSCSQSGDDSGEKLSVNCHAGIHH
jgi:hypothetical protein